MAFHTTSTREEASSDRPITLQQPRAASMRRRDTQSCHGIGRSQPL